MPGHDVTVANLEDVQVSQTATPRERLVEMMNRYEQPLSNYLLVLLGDRDVVGDCAQDAFLRAYEHLNRGKTVNAQWLYRVARNRAIDHLRHRNRVSHGSDVLDTMESQERQGHDPAAAVRRALEQLSAGDREILYLFVVDKFDTAEIAAMLGIRPGATRVRLTRARERFRVIYRGTV